jgi:hypothetical protein
MQIQGEIRSADNTAGFTCEAWCQLVSDRAEFRRPAPVQRRNPLTGEAMILYPPQDAADVVIGGNSVGQVYWSMSDEPLVNVSIEPAALHLVLEWAAALGGVFHNKSKVI